MNVIKKAKAAVLEHQRLSGAKTVSNCEASMPSKLAGVNNQEVTREHDAYGKSNGGQSGQLTA